MLCSPTLLEAFFLQVAFSSIFSRETGQVQQVVQATADYVRAGKLYDEMLLDSEDASALTSLDSMTLHVSKFPI